MEEFWLEVECPDGHVEKEVQEIKKIASGESHQASVLVGEFWEKED